MATNHHRALPHKAESADENNRGQYWQVKMTDPDKRAIYGAFYSQGFDGNRKRFVFTPAQRHQGSACG